VDLILDSLNNIYLPYDLYCSIGNESEYQKIKNKILDFNPDAHIIDVSNVGYDIWPFVHIINNVDLSHYEYIVKLHTKRDMDWEIPKNLGNGFYVGTGTCWRDNLFAFISTKDAFNKCVEALKDQKIGMCARFNLIHNAPNHCGVLDYARARYPQYILNLYNYTFVAGTMFVAKAAPFKILKDMNIDDTLFEAPTTTHETQFAHVIERTIGEIIYKSGMIITDPFTPQNHIKKILRLYNRLKLIKRLINYMCFPIPIQVIRHKIKDKLFLKKHLSRIIHILDIDKEDSKNENSCGINHQKETNNEKILD
jgi:lipopolysaccharide biosynthesis protein